MAVDVVAQDEEIVVVARTNVPPLILKKGRMLPFWMVVQSLIFWFFELALITAMPLLTYQLFAHQIYPGAVLYFFLSVYFLFTFGGAVVAYPAMFYGAHLIERQRHREAEKILAATRRLYIRFHLRKDFTYHTLQSNLALHYTASGNFHQAETLYDDIIARISARKANLNYAMTAIYLNNQALVYLHQGEYEGAEKLARKALAIWSAKKGNDANGMAYPLANLLVVHLHNGDLDALHQDADKAIALITSDSQPGYIVAESRIGVYAQCLLYKGIAFMRQGRAEDGVALARALITCHASGMHPQFGYSIPGLNEMAKRLVEVGENALAEDLLEIAYEILMRHPMHSDGPALLDTYADLLVATGREGEVTDLKNWVRPGKMLLNG